jgi:lysophospholipase L1-like esterase
MKVFAFLLLSFACASAQTQPAPATPLLNTAAAGELANRIGQLMESTAAVVPGMGKTSAIIAENARQTLSAMQVTPDSSALTYEFLSQARGYLALLDAMPKPYPLPDAARKQFTELRDSVERLDNHLRALLDRKEVQLRNPDRDNLRRYADANAKLNAPTPNFTRVIFYGDSITDFWRLNEYFTGRDYVNRGISGQVTGEMLGRMKADVIDLHPHAMIILAGTNDISRGVAIHTIENNLSMIGDLCKANHIVPIFASILPVSDYHKRENPRFEMTKTRPPGAIVDINNWMREYCRSRNFVYVDYWSAMKDANGMLPADLADDGLHPNAKGYRMMAPIAVQGLDEALSERSPEQQPPAKKRKSIFGQ